MAAAATGGVLLTAAVIGAGIYFFRPEREEKFEEEEMERSKRRERETSLGRGVEELMAAREGRAWGADFGEELRELSDVTEREERVLDRNGKKHKRHRMAAGLDVAKRAGSALKERTRRKGRRLEKSQGRNWDLLAAEAEARVMNALIEDPILAGRRIEVGPMESGIIELWGWVNDASERERAIRVAQGVPGVVSVICRLSLREIDDGLADMAGSSATQGLVPVRNLEEERALGVDPMDQLEFADTNNTNDEGAADQSPV